MLRVLLVAAVLLLSSAIPAGAAWHTTRTAAWFQTPTGNIGCALNVRWAACNIGDRTWAPPPKPSWCPVDWGDGVTVSNGQANFRCAGDTVQAPGVPFLAYGQSRSRGPFTCMSRTRGITCRNRRTGHGFTLSVTSYDFF